MSGKRQEVREVFAELARGIGRPVRLMEVCGSHSLAIAKAGLRALLPASVRLLSGPGCPVCVSGEDFISRTILLARFLSTAHPTFFPVVMPSLIPPLFLRTT